jgi:hypothetical protein
VVTYGLTHCRTALSTRKIKRNNKIARFGSSLWHRPKRFEPWSLLMMPIRKGRKVSRIIGCIPLTLTVFPVTGFVLLVLIGLWGCYEKEATALGFSAL